MWGIDSRLNRLVELSTDSWELVSNDANGCIIRRIADAFIDYRLPISASGAFSNDANIIDRDVDTAASISTSAPGKSVEDIGFQDNEITAANGFTSISAKFYIVAEESGTAWFGNPLLADLYVDDTPADRWTIEPDDSFATHSNTLDIANYESVDLTFENVDGGTHGLNLFEAYLAVKFQGERDIDLYWGGLGEVYTTDYDLANRPNHADTGETGNAIENFIGAIEWHLRTVNNLTDDSLDLDSFDTASNLVSGLKASLSISEQPDTLEHLFQLVQNYKCFLWWDANNVLTIRVLEDDYQAPDIVVEGSLAMDLDYDRTDEREVYGAVQVFYSGVNETSRGETPVDVDTTALDFNGLLQDQSFLPFESIGYGDLATAVSMGAHLKENQKLSHSVLVTGLPEIYAHLAVGTLIGVVDPPKPMRGHDLQSPYDLGGQTFRQFFLVLKATRFNGVALAATQVVKLDV